jgi:tetratricopeptide (TPR) repeat protein
VRADLGAARRAALHRRVATALERAPGEPPVELLAYHYGRAGDHEQAITFLIRAAERARQTSAYREAAASLAEAIALADGLGQHARAAELRATRGEVFTSVGLWSEALTDLTASLEGLGPERAGRRAEVLVELARTYWWLLDCPTGGHYAEEALQLAEQVGRDDLAASATTYLAQVPKSDGRMMQSRSLLIRGRARPGGASNPDLLELSTLVHYLVGDTDQAIRLGHEAVAAMRRTHSAGGTVSALASFGLALGAGGRYGEAMQAFDEAARLGREYEVRAMLARAMACSTGLHVDVFDYAGAELHAAAAYEMARSINWVPSAASAGIDRLMTFVRRGEVGRAEALLDEVVRLSELPNTFHEWQWRIRLTEVRGELALARGEWEEALRWVNHSLRQSRLSRRRKYVVIGLGTRARILAATGRVKQAIIDLRRAVTLARGVGDPAQFLRVGVALLALDGDDLLAAEARAAADRIVAALPDEAMRRQFREAEIVRDLGRR